MKLREINDLRVKVLIGGIIFVSSKFHEPYKVMYKNWIRTEVLDGLFTIDSFVPTKGFYAEDERDAFYVLNPSFMERIIELKNAVEGRIIIGIVDNKIHILCGDEKNAWSLVY